MSRRKPVPAEGPEVFPESEEGEGSIVLVPVDGKLLRCRMTAPSHPVRDLTEDEYCGTKENPRPAGS